MGEAGCRDGVVVEHVGALADVLHGTDALRAGGMCQHVFACMARYGNWTKLNLKLYFICTPCAY